MRHRIARSNQAVHPSYEPPSGVSLYSGRTRGHNVAPPKKNQTPDLAVRTLSCAGFCLQDKRTECRIRHPPPVFSDLHSRTRARSTALATDRSELHSPTARTSGPSEISPNKIAPNRLRTVLARQRHF